MTAHELAHALLLRPDVPVVVIGYGAATFVTRAALAERLWRAVEVVLG